MDDRIIVAAVTAFVFAVMCIVMYILSALLCGALWFIVGLVTD